MQEVETAKKGIQGKNSHVRPVDPSKRVSPIGPPPGQLDSVGLRFWEDSLANAKWLSVTDAAALYALTLMYQRYVDADTRYWNFLATLMDPFNKESVVMAKELAVMHTALNRAFGELGLTPRSRNDQGLAEVKLRSKMDDFLDGQKKQQDKKRYGREGGNVKAKKEKKAKGLTPGGDLK